MVNLALLWAEAYQKENPGVRISVTGGGSGTGITALMTNTVDIANASRAIKPEEIKEDEYIEPEVIEEAPEEEVIEEPIQEVKKTTRKKSTN